MQLPLAFSSAACQSSNSRDRVDQRNEETRVMHLCA